MTSKQYIFDALLTPLNKQRFVAPTRLPDVASKAEIPITLVERYFSTKTAFTAYLWHDAWQQSYLYCKDELRDEADATPKEKWLEALTQWFEFIAPYHHALKNLWQPKDSPIAQLIDKLNAFLPIELPYIAPCLLPLLPEIKKQIEWLKTGLEIQENCSLEHQKNSTLLAGLVLLQLQSWLQAPSPSADRIMAGLDKGFEKINI